MTKKPRKIQVSLSFRKNTPGRRMASIRQMSAYQGQMYTFGYTSWGPTPKRRGAKNKAKENRNLASGKRPNRDKQPLLLLAVRKGEKIWKAKNGKSYIYGFNLNYLESHQRLDVIRKLAVIFEEHEGESLSYLQIKSALNLPSSKEDSIFRKYDIRGSKLRHLKQVDLNTYTRYLEKALNSGDRN